MDSNLPLSPGLERISSSCSTSSVCTTSTMSSSADTIISDENAAILDYHPPPSESTSTGTTKRRKRQNSTMIIKPTRWSLPLCYDQQTQQHHFYSDTHNEKNGPSNNVSAIDTEFKPTFYNPNEIKHRRRISTHQCSVLEQEYHTNNKPNASKRHQLAEQLDMTPRTVQIWFQNKRAKAKQQQQQQQQQKNKSVLQTATCHYATLPKSSSISSTIKKSDISQSAAKASTIPLDMFTFDDGRLDPIYLIDDHSVATLPSSASSKCDNGHVVAAAVAPMIGLNDTSMMSDHETMKSTPSQPSPPSTAPAAAPIKSTLLTSETTGTCDAFTMWPHSNDTQHHDTLPSFSSATTSSSSTPLQPFSSLDLFDVLQPFQQSYDIMDDADCEEYKNMIHSSTCDSFSSPYTKQQQQQQQQNCHDCSTGHLWTEKPPTDSGFPTSMVSTWPYMMNQHQAIQNDYLNFALDQDDWMGGPFSTFA